MTDTATWPAPAPSAMTPVPYRVRSRIAENRDSSTLQPGTGGRTATRTAARRIHDDVRIRDR